MYIDKLSQVETKNIGQNTRIWQFVVILPGVIIGKNCNICSHTFIENEVIIGNDVTIKNGVHIYTGVQMGDSVFIGPNVTFTNDLVPRSKVHPDKYLKTIIGQGVSIGANSTIIAGISIGRFAMVGAASLVTKNVPPHSLWYGHPAKHQGYICECGAKLSKIYECPSCLKRYKINNKTLCLESRN